MNRIYAVLLLATFGITGIEKNGLAAQSATISADQAAIRERPESDAKIIESRSAGSEVRISSHSKNGWYKAKTSSGQYGWIWQGDLLVMSSSSDVQAAHLDIKEKTRESRRNVDNPWLFLRAGGSLFGILSTDVSSRLGAGKSRIYVGPGGFLEASVRVSERLRGALRLATYSAKGSLTNASQRSYSVTLSSNPLLLGLDADVSQSDILDFSAGVYAGLGAGTSLSVSAPSLPTPNSFTVKKTTFAFMINFSGKYHLKRWLSAVGEFGIFYTSIPKTAIPGAFNGDEPFRDATGGATNIQVNHVGPVIGIGLQASI